MNKKIFSSCLGVGILSVAALTLTGCGDTATVHIQKGDDFFAERQKADKVTYVLEDDITVYAKRGAFSKGEIFRPLLENDVFEGNNHTITIKGNKGTITEPYFTDMLHTGLFETIKNSTVKDLNIVFDFEIEMSGKYAGGLAAWCTDSTIENVDIAFDNGVSSSSSYFGGLVGDAHRSTITNCSSEGTISASGMAMGGLVGVLVDSKLSFSHCDSDINASGIREYHNGSYSQASGGLVGYVDSGCELFASYVSVKKMIAELNSDRWSSVYHDAGLLAGYNNGAHVHDCYIDIENAANINLNAKSYGTFIRVMNGAFMIGNNQPNSKVENIYIDFTEAESILSDTKNSYPLGFAINESTNSENLYMVKRDGYYDTVSFESVRGEQMTPARVVNDKIVFDAYYSLTTQLGQDNPFDPYDSVYLTYSFDKPKDSASSIDYGSTKMQLVKAYDINSGAEPIIIGNAENEGDFAKDVKLVDNRDEVLAKGEELFYSLRLEMNDEIRGVSPVPSTDDLYEIESVPSLNITMAKKHYAIENARNVAVVAGYDALDFTESEDIIGQEKKNYWIKNQDGKPIINESMIPQDE